MRKSLILAAATAVAALSSCSTVKNTAYTATPETMIINMTVADLDVSQSEISATVNWNWNPFKKISNVEKAAEAAALKASGADVLVEPIYEVNKRGFLRGGSVTVTGHPATFRNFRPMTMKDAEIISTLKNKVAVGTPLIPTSGPSFIDRLKPDKEKVSDDTNSFLSFVYSFTSSDDIKKGWSVGLMYGRYNTWGWYTKLTLDGGEDNYFNDHGYYAGGNSMGFTLTGGAIRQLPKNFNVFAGLGVGKAIPSGFAIPIEIGAMWNYRHFNVMLGYQYAINCGSFAGLSKPFIGVGYNF